MPRTQAQREWRSQAFLFACAYLLYSAARWVCVGDIGTATQHARWIVDLEQGTRSNIESSVQGALTGTPVIWLLNHVYVAAQLVVLPGSLIWLFRNNRAVYVQLRNTIVPTWLIALPIYAAYPCAPPRLAHIGIADTISGNSGMSMDSSFTTSFYNPLAAVPSLHVGFAVAIGIALAAAMRTPTMRFFWLAWGPLVTLAVIATGNHFVFDAVAGLIVTAAGYTAGRHADALHARLRRSARPRVALGLRSSHETA